MTLTKRRFLTIKDAKKRFERLGLSIVDEAEFVNSNSKMTAVDKEGYRVYMLVERLPRLKSYRRFDKNNPYTIDNIKLWVKLNDPDYELLSTEYNGSEEKLEWRMKSRADLSTFFTSWHMFYSDGTRHPDLRFTRISDSKRREPNEIRKSIDRILKERYDEWSLDEGEEFNYRTVKQSQLKFSHKDGYKSISTIALLENEKQRALPLFHPSYHETSIHNVWLYTHLYSQYELVEGQQYSYFRDKYKFICEEHGEFTNNFSTVYTYNTGCQKCIYKQTLGENNPNWKSHLTKVERGNRYTREMIVDGYAKWRRNVLKRDEYTCQICGSEEKHVAHHKDGFHWCEERRVDITNGVTLCIVCHNDFHSLYGWHYNTEEQYLEYEKDMKQIIAEQVNNNIQQVE